MLSVFVDLIFALLWTVYYILERTVRLIVPAKFLVKDVKGQIVLITGGGSGIGRLLCLRFGKLGATVVTWDINEAGNKETVEMVKSEGGIAYDYTVDMSNKDDIYSAAQQTVEEIGPVSILINNAGIVSGSSLLDTPDSKVIRTFQVNTLAHFWTIKFAAVGMDESLRVELS